MTEKEPSERDDNPDHDFLDEGLERIADEMDNTEESAESAADYRRVEALWSNLILGALFLSFAYHFMTSFQEKALLSTFFMIVLSIAHAFPIILRYAPEAVSTKPEHWTFSIGATWLAMLILAFPASAPHGGLFLMQICAIVFLICGLVSLGKSYGIVPARRPIKSGGVYRLVRHPLYLGYIVACFCAVLQHITPLTMTLFVLMVLVQIFAIRFEEDYLRDDPRYVLYQGQVPKKLIPFIW